jgi:transcription initiation factor TFIIIB Brf1 subunit/transcription initiation factor TFIIB
MSKNVNYSEEVTATIVAAYAANPTMQTVRDLAEIYEKTTKSIIGKLSREGVYQKSSYTTKTGNKPVTKIELVTQLADYLGIDVDSIAGLEKSPKAALQKILDELTIN